MNVQGAEDLLLADAPGRGGIFPISNSALPMLSRAATTWCQITTSIVLRFYRVPETCGRAESKRDFNTRLTLPQPSIVRLFGMAIRIQPRQQRANAAVGQRDARIGGTVV